MPNVVSSSFTLDVPQADGRRRVYQTFVMDDGTTRTCDHLADADEDYNAVMASTAATFGGDS